MPACASAFVGYGVVAFFVLQRRKEDFGDRVVPAVGFATHARHKAKAGYRPPEVTTRVLAATVGVEQHTGLSRRPMPGVEEGVLDEGVRHPVCEALAEHLSRLQAQHHGQVQPAFTGFKVGDVTHPCRYRARHFEAALEHVGSHGPGMVALRGVGPPAPIGFATES